MVERVHRGVAAATKGKGKGRRSGNTAGKGGDPADEGATTATDGFVTSMAPWIEEARSQLSSLQASLGVRMLLPTLLLTTCCSPLTTYNLQLTAYCLLLTLYS